jgi:hypothetical protein
MKIFESWIQKFVDDSGKRSCLWGIPGTGLRRVRGILAEKIATTLRGVSPSLIPRRRPKQGDAVAASPPTRVTIIGFKRLEDRRVGSRAAEGTALV